MKNKKTFCVTDGTSLIARSNVNLLFKKKLSFKSAHSIYGWLIKTINLRVIYN